jgi:hypothetical protein
LDPPADGVVDGQHPVKEDSERQAHQQQSGRNAFESDWDMTDTATRQPRGLSACDIEGDISPRVSCTHNKDAAITQLGRTTVLVRMQLQDAGVKLHRELWHGRSLVAGHCHHHVVGLNPTVL